MLKSKRLSIVTSAAALLVTGLLAAAPARADTFTFTACHLTGGCGTATDFGTVTLTQSGTSVDISASLTLGNRFVQTGAAARELFLFNDPLAGSTVTGADTVPAGAISGGIFGMTNFPATVPPTGTFTASIECTTLSQCSGGAIPTITGLTFTVTHATVAQLGTANATGNIFIADILLGQAGGTGSTGVVAVNTPAVVVPDESSSLTLTLFALVVMGLAFRPWRKRTS